MCLCINPVFCFLCSDALTLRALLALEDWSSQGQATSRDSKQCTHVPFKCKPINPEPTTSPQLHYGVSHSCHYSPTLTIPGSGTRQLGTALYPTAQWNYSNESILNMFNLSLLILPMETTIKALVHNFFFSLSLTLALPPVAPVAPVVCYAPSLGICRCNKLPFQRQLSLLALSYPNNNKTY